MMPSFNAVSREKFYDFISSRSHEMTLHYPSFNKEFRCVKSAANDTFLGNFCNKKIKKKLIIPYSIRQEWTLRLGYL
jgi:hypothetical protein